MAMATGGNLYDAIGDLDGCRRLSKAFYRRVADDPVLRPIFPSSFHCAVEALALYLAQTLGGPSEYSKKRWGLSLRESHMRFRIGAAERDAWLAAMRLTLEEVGVAAPASDALMSFFEQASVRIVNRGVATAGEATVNPLMAGPWQEEVALDDLSRAVKAGDALRAFEIAENDAVRVCFARDRGALLSMLDMMAASGDAEMIAYVDRRLRKDTALVHDRYTANRTLLHGIAASGVLALVETLLELGADPNALDEAGHTPLYCLANETQSNEAGATVHALVQAGADVNAAGGVKRCTPLHMAARRGNVGVAEALLNHGAWIEARDSRGDTPLRRALNCRKNALAEFLTARGASQERNQR